MRRYLLPAIRITACAVIAGAVAGAVVAWRRFGPATYVRADTMFGRARIYEVEGDDGSPVRLLEVGGIVQSGTYTDDERYAELVPFRTDRVPVQLRRIDDERYAELVFEYLKRYDVMFEGERAGSVERVCVLGCGGYDYPEHLLAHHPGVVVDAVEIDAAITTLARRYFYLDRAIEEFDPHGERLHLFCADALEFLEGTDARYGAIVNDAFDAGDAPAHLATPEFAHLVHARLAPGGMYLTNIVSALEGPGAAFLDEQVAILEAEFDHVQVLPCDPDSLTEPDNVIVIAF